MNKIPSDEDFARASKYMDEQSRNLDKVRNKVIQNFKNICPLHDFYLLDQIDVDFRAYVFFEKEKDIQEFKNNGIIKNIIDFVYSELELADRGKREEITVAFEFDSDENVTANFGGDYFIRLR